jgi:hypothetical protein
MVWFLIFCSCNHNSFSLSKPSTLLILYQCLLICMVCVIPCLLFIYSILSKGRSVDLKKKHGFYFIYVVFRFLII